MKILEDMILERGIAVNEDILKVDSFVNHQVDPELMKNIGDEFAEHFKGQGITKVATCLLYTSSAIASSSVCINAPFPVLTSNTMASAPDANFLLIMLLAIKDI